jgi:hypothetical protein
MNQHGFSCSAGHVADWHSEYFEVSYERGDANIGGDSSAV